MENHIDLYSKKNTLCVNAMISLCYIVCVNLINPIDSSLDNLMKTEAHMDLDPIEVASQCPNKKLAFLDIQIWHDDTRFRWNVYRKPTDKNTVLHYPSFHPQHQKEGILDSCVVRMWRLNTEVVDLERELVFYAQRFISRGYPRELVYTKFKSRLSILRSNTASKRDQSDDDMLYWVDKYSPLNDILTRKFRVATRQVFGTELTLRSYSKKASLNLKSHISPSCLRIEPHINVTIK